MSHITELHALFTAVLDGCNRLDGINAICGTSDLHSNRSGIAAWLYTIGYYSIQC